MEILAAAQAQAGTVSAAPFAGGVLYVANGDAETAMQTLGVSREQAPNYVRKLARNLLSGSLDLADGTLVLSDVQAQEIGVGVGDEISVYAGQNVNAMVRKFRAANDEEDKEKKKLAYQQIKLHPQKLKVGGIIRAEKGGYYGYTSLKTGQEVFALGQEVTGIAVELQDPNQARAFAEALKPTAIGWNFQLWTDAGEARLAAMGNEQTMMQLVLSIIALVAAFSVMNTTITVTTQKRREIGVLTALGCRPGQVVRVFLYQAIFVGVLGTGLGLGGGLLILHYRNNLREALAIVTGGQVHAVEGVFLSTIPAYVQPWDVAITCTISLVLCVVAGLIPAWFASRVDSAVALRD
jgi:lipoprotein-releasing system permease protein